MKTISKNQIIQSADDYKNAISSIDEIIEEIKAGRPVIITDDEDRENEGDLIIAAECASAELINFMAKEGRGLICLPMEGAMVERLDLELMGRGDNKHHRTAFTVSIEAREGVTTGISAADRAHTILTAIDPKMTRNDIATPGHVFPLKARDGGVLVRAGHTEAAVDLARMAGFSGAGVICEIMNDDGTMSRLPDLVGFAQLHNLKIGTIADLIAYRSQRECFVECIHEGEFSSNYGGAFALKIYANTIQYAEHIVLIKGDISKASGAIPVRMHGVDILQDVLGGSNGNSSLHKAMQIIDEASVGVIVLLREPDAKSVSKRLKNTGEGEKNNNTLRNYGIGAQILRDLGIRKMSLITNHPNKNIIGLDGYDLHIDGFIPLDENGQ